MPAPTAPHVLCTASNLVVDFQTARAIQCPRSRPGYMCAGTPTFLEFKRNGGWSSLCLTTSDFQPRMFPADHLRDYALAFAGASSSEQMPVVDLDMETPVVLVTRERGEHFNWYHSTTDLVNAFISCYVNGWDPAEVDVVFLDNHKSGPYDHLWARLFRKLVRTSTFYNDAMRLAGGKVVRFARAALSPPGYTSIFFDKNPQCTGGVGLLRAYATYVLNGLGLQMRDLTGAPKSTPLRITFISRRPYHSFVDHSFMGRQIANEAELVDMLHALGKPPKPLPSPSPPPPSSPPPPLRSSHAGNATEAKPRSHRRVVQSPPPPPSPRSLRTRPVVVDVVDFSQYAFSNQLDIVSQTDVLVGMHGAALTHSLFLPDHAALVELRPVDDSPPMYARTSQWSGIHYASWTNTAFPANHIKDENGDYTTIDLEELREIMAEVIDVVIGRIEDD